MSRSTDNDLRFAPINMPSKLAADLGAYTANLVTGYDFTDKGICLSFAEQYGNVSLENRFPVPCSVEYMGEDSRGHAVYHIRTEWE